MREDPLPLRILELRAQIAELSSTIRQLQRSGSTMPHRACCSQEDGQSSKI
jgi:hypothetical protein